MSFTATIEHIWMPREDLPRTLHLIFEHGVCVVFADQEMVAAIPATNDETNQLADLFEIAAIALSEDDPAMVVYRSMRDRLCGGKGYQMLSALFQQEMEKQKDREEGPRSKFLKMASAARNN